MDTSGQKKRGKFANNCDYVQLAVRTRHIGSKIDHLITQRRRALFAAGVFLLSSAAFCVLPSEISTNNESNKAIVATLLSTGFAALVQRKIKKEEKKLDQLLGDEFNMDKWCRRNFSRGRIAYTSIALNQHRISR
jgi:hypothetical protein